MNLTETTEFASDVIAGLSSHPKQLSSKYFYDDRGSMIFKDIMQMPEYYLTDCELEIFKNQKADIADEINPNGIFFELIELGAGDGFKTIVLLNYLVQQKINFQYIPIDISAKANENLQYALQLSLPNLALDCKTGDYLKLISGLTGTSPKIILFLGSNIGNLTENESLSFLKQLRNVLNKGDKLLIGFDLKKDPEIILKAYNDPHGHTTAFNLNLLHRINAELGANFNTDYFYHEETYDHQTGTAKSFLISKKDQSVRFGKTNKIFRFTANEKILMEISQKYDETMINNFAKNSGFTVERNFIDSRSWFIDSLWKVE